MAKEIDKIIQSKTAPKNNNVLWDDGENLKIYRNGKWENANNNEAFIPDTVIKTTPQTLSDTDKNQALANLGINPVVWKYLLNPYKINVIYDGNNWSYDEKISDPALVEVLVKNKDLGRLLIVVNNNDELYVAFNYINDETTYKFNIDDRIFIIEIDSFGNIMSI